MIGTTSARTSLASSDISSSVVFHDESVELFDEIDELYPHVHEGGKLVSDPHARSGVRTDASGSEYASGGTAASTMSVSGSRSMLASSLLSSLRESARASGRDIDVPMGVDSLVASSNDGTLAEIIAGLEDRYKSSLTMSQASIQHRGNSAASSSPNNDGGSTNNNNINKRESIVGGRQISKMTFEEQRELLAPERSDRSLVVDMEGGEGDEGAPQKDMLDASEKSLERSEKSMCYYSPTILPSNPNNDDTAESENVIVSSVDWSSLSKSCKRARDAFRDADSGQMVVKNMFLTHLGALTTVLTLYAKRYCRGAGANNNDGGTQTLDKIKAQTRETKRALRFAMSCLAPPRSAVQENSASDDSGGGGDGGVEKYRTARRYRQELQEAAVRGFSSSRLSSPTGENNIERTNNGGNNGNRESRRHYYGLQIPLCEIIRADNSDFSILSSVQDEKRTVRVLAARMLCNLVTDNPLAAEIVLRDVPFSPDLDSALGRSNAGGAGDGHEVPYWSDLVVATARVSPFDDVSKNNGKGGGGKGNEKRDDNSEDREALAAVAAALHNLLTSLESRESLLELDDEMRRRELAKLERQRRSAELEDGVEIEFARRNATKPIDVGFEVASNGLLLNALLRNILPARAVLMQAKLERERAEAEAEAEASSRPQFRPPAAAEPDDTSDSATEWISLVLERLASRGLLPNMLRSSGSERSGAVTPEQVVLVSCIRQAVDDYHSALTPAGESGGFGRRRLSVDAKRTAGMTVTTRPHPLWGRADVAAGALSGGAAAARTTPSRDSRTAVPVLLTLANEAEGFRRRAEALSDGECEEAYDGEGNCAARVIDDLCDILAQCLGRHATPGNPVGGGGDDRGATIRGCFLADARSVLGRETGLIASCCVDLGRILDAALASNAGKKARELRLSARDQRTAIVMVRLLGNLVYQCRYNQDLLRITPIPMPANTVPDATAASSASTSNDRNDAGESGAVPSERTGLHVVLSATSLAPACFTLREWCIVAIRNAVEGNAANAETIRRLETNQALGDTPELRRMGVKIETDERGNVQVMRRDS